MLHIVYIYIYMYMYIVPVSFHRRFVRFSGNIIIIDYVFQSTHHCTIGGLCLLSLAMFWLPWERYSSSLHNIRYSLNTCTCTCMIRCTCTCTWILQCTCMYMYFVHLLDYMYMCVHVVYLCFSQKVV